MAGGGLNLLIGAAGIWTAFLFYGSLQEDVLVYEDANGVKFTQLWTLQAIEALANVVLGFLGRLMWSPSPTLPGWHLFAITGGAQVAAKYFTSASTTYGLAYSVATLAKSAKMVPVMIGTLFIGGASYKTRDYVQTGLIIAGTVLVSMGKKGKGGNSTTGLVCIVLSLIMDGLVGGTQKKVQKSLSKYPFDIMTFTNVFMLLVSAVAALVMNELTPGLAYLQDNADILPKILAFAACSAVGQCFIFFTIANFGPLEVTAITTTRKIGTVLVSIFKKFLATGQTGMGAQGWAGIGLATIGIMGEVAEKMKKDEKKDDAAAEKRRQ